jgi:hypothetical protein
MESKEGFKKYLGRTEHNHDYMVLFAKEIDAKGVDGVLQEYVFAGKLGRGDDYMASAEKQATRGPTICLVDSMQVSFEPNVTSHLFAKPSRFSSSSS